MASKMLKEILYYLINASIMAVFIFAVVIAIRLIGKKWFTKNMIVFLWLFVLLRLLVPFALTTNFSLIASFNESIVKSVPIGDSAESKIAFSNIIKQADEYEPITYKTLKFEQILLILSRIWVIGFFLISLILSYIYIKYIKKLKISFSEKIDHYDIYTSNMIKTPMVIGIVKPKIVLPVHIDEEIKRFAVLHELTHIKRKDNLVKAIFTFAAVLHWFNPIVWVMLKQLAKDIELACDESVIKKLTKKSVKEYASALVLANEQMKSYITAFSSNQLEKRIYAIVAYQKLSRIMFGFLVAIYGVLSVILLTNG